MLIHTWKMPGAVVFKGAVSLTVAGALAIHELQHPAGEPHATHDIEIFDAPEGRVAIEAVTSGTMAPFSGMADGGYRRPPQDYRYYAQGEQQTPFPLRFL